jgi:hypothetical protein
MFTVKVWFRLMVFNTTFNNISAISWRSVVLVEETGVPGENHRPDADVIFTKFSKHRRKILVSILLKKLKKKKQKKHGLGNKKP